MDPKGVLICLRRPANRKLSPVRLSCSVSVIGHCCTTCSCSAQCPHSCIDEVYGVPAVLRPSASLQGLPHACRPPDIKATRVRHILDAGATLVAPMSHCADGPRSMKDVRALEPGAARQRTAQQTWFEGRDMVERKDMGWDGAMMYSQS